MLIIKLLSQQSTNVSGSDGHFILIATLETKYLQVKQCIVSLNQYSTLSVEQNFLLIVEEEKQHYYFDMNLRPENYQTTKTAKQKC